MWSQTEKNILKTFGFTELRSVEATIVLELCMDPKWILWMEGL